MAKPSLLRLDEKLLVWRHPIFSEKINQLCFVTFLRYLWFARPNSDADDDDNDNYDDDDNDNYDDDDSDNYDNDDDDCDNDDNDDDDISLKNLI